MTEEKYLGDGPDLLTIVSVKYPDAPRNMIKITKGTWNRNYMRYSRFLIEKKLGRSLKENEIVHHLNGNTLDDRIENLKIMTRVEHTSFHRKGKIPIEGIKVFKEKRRKEREKYKPKIKELTEKNYSIKEITDRLDIGTNTIRKIMKEANISVDRNRRYRRKREKWKPKIKKLQKDGLTHKEITWKVPFSRPTIGKILRDEYD